jgi:hypothetical protein
LKAIHVIAGCLLAANLYLLVELYYVKRPVHPRDGRLEALYEDLERRVTANVERIETLQHGLSDAGSGSGPAGYSGGEQGGRSDKGYDLLLERIEELERNAADAAGFGVKETSEKPLASLLMDGSVASSGSIERSIYQPNQAGEDAFESDDGRPLGEHEEQILEAFFSATDLIELQDMNCRKSICRITYKSLPADSPDMGPGNESTILLTERLLDHVRGVDLVLRHGKDAMGQGVMYLQIK